MTNPHKISSSLLIAAALAFAGCTTNDETQVGFRGDDHEDTGHAGDSGDTGKHEETGGETGDVGDTGGDTGGQADACTRTQGYWRNHNIYAAQSQNQIPWPISEDTALCGQTYLEWLGTPPQGDAWIILVHQWIAASLNVAAGVDASDDVDDALADAADLLSSCSISDEDRDMAIELSEMLDSFNNGEMGSEHCDDLEERLAN